MLYHKLNLTFTAKTLRAYFTLSYNEKATKVVHKLNIKYLLLEKGQDSISVGSGLKQKVSKVPNYCSRHSLAEMQANAKLLLEPVTVASSSFFERKLVPRRRRRRRRCRRRRRRRCGRRRFRFSGKC